MKKNVIEKISRDFGGSPQRSQGNHPDLIDEYLTIYLNAYPAYKDLSDESIAGYRNKYLNSTQNDENITFVGLFEEGEFIALMKLIDFYEYIRQNGPWAGPCLWLFPLCIRRKAPASTWSAFEKIH